MHHILSTSDSSPCVRRRGCECNARQRIATHCITLQHTATTHCKPLKHPATHCTSNTLQRNATHAYASNCDTLQAMSASARSDIASCHQHTATTLQHTATHCNTLQHIPTYCNALQAMSVSARSYTASLPPTYRYCTALHCQTLQHSATLCNTPQ